MKSSIKEYAADHRYLLACAARQADLRHPVAIHLDELSWPLLKAARRQQLVPIDGVLVRNWHRGFHRYLPGVKLGMRLYEIEGIRFVRVCFQHQKRAHVAGLDFFVV